jgi:hypothetical protein
MNVFAEAIRKGLLNAAREGNGVMRINHLLGELNDAIHQLTEGTVSVGVYGWSGANSPDRSPGLLRAFSLRDNVRRYELIAYREECLLASKEHLADWIISDRGWPCRVRFNGRECVCEDVESLREALNELLSSVRAGTAFKKVLEFQSGNVSTARA